MSARQLIILVVAAIAALGALLLVRNMGGGGSTAQATSAPIAGEQVLVVTVDVPQGAALKPSDLAWRAFPTESAANLIRATASPSAQADYVGAVTRHAFVAGEPLIPAAVVQPNNHGFMAAQLRPGFRAVAVKVLPETMVGGYIQPNDHVDVIVTVQTQRSDNNGGSGVDVHSEPVLQDIRVLALGDTVQTQTTGDAPTRVTADVAVLELTADDATLLAQADTRGDISLSLRGVEADAADQVAESSSQRRGQRSRGTVLMHSFGTVSNGGGR